MRIVLTALALAVCSAAAACSSSGSAPAREPGSVVGSAPAIGRTVPTTGAAAVAGLGQPITQGALKITVKGPVSTEKDGAELLVTFDVTMVNTAASGDVIGPDWFGVRCDVNRTDRMPGDEVATTTVSGARRIAAGQTVTGVAVDAWLKWNSISVCTGPTTVEARFLNNAFESWTIPAEAVAQINAAGGS